MAYYLSTSGALASTAVMCGFKKVFGHGLSVVGISVAGAVTITSPSFRGKHNPPPDGCHVLPPLSSVVCDTHRDFCGILAGRIIVYTETLSKKYRG